MIRKLVHLKVSTRLVREKQNHSNSGYLGI